MDLDFKNYKGSYFLIFLIVITFLCDNFIFNGSLFKLFCGKGIDNISFQECYRIFTQFLLNPNFLYVICNSIALFCLGKYIEKVIGSKNLLLVFFSANIFVFIIASVIFHGYSVLCGSSPGIYALAIIMFILAFKHNNLIHFNFVTFTGSFIVAYFLICNIVNLHIFIINILGILMGIAFLAITHKKWLSA